MAKYNVFETTNMRAVHRGERIMDAVYTNDIENGTFGYLDGLADGETHIYKFVPGFKAGMPVFVAKNPEWDEDECRRINQRRDQFVIKAGTAFRVYRLHTLDEFATAIEGVTAATKEAMKDGAFVSIDGTTGKLVAAAAPAENAVMVGEVMRHRQQGVKIVTGVREYGYPTTLYTVQVKYLAPVTAPTVAAEDDEDDGE